MRKKSSKTKNPFYPVIGNKGIISCQEKIAADIGLKILKTGNAIDAAVAIGFALSVTFPRAGNIGGGGFMLIRNTNNDITCLDYREKAPKKSTTGMFQDERGKVIPDKPSYSFLSIGIPGTVHGLLTALENYGTISIKQAIKPAIKLARNGFKVYKDLYNTLLSAKDKLKKSPSSLETFYRDDKPYSVGDVLHQKHLGNTLEIISEKGIEGFYKGDIPRKIVNYVTKNGGILSIEDFNSYESRFRDPIIGSYRDFEVYSMPPPSSGGTILVEMLNILENYSLNHIGYNTAEYISILSQAMKFSYYDRYRYLGDTDFVEVPIEKINSKEYSKLLASQINPNKYNDILQEIEFITSNETTHFSVMDIEGNVVSNTYSLALNYGSGFMAPGTGFLLNNEMGDFTAKLGHIDGSGMKGGINNTIKPEKRMLSSMTPTIICQDQNPFLAIGAAGGSQIITTVLQVILNVIDHEMNIAEAINALRFHHQWKPTHLKLEPGFDKDIVIKLKEMGYIVKSEETIANSQGTMLKDGVYLGAADPRCSCSKAIGF